MIAGAVSSLPFAVYFVAGILPRAWKDLSLTVVKLPSLAQHVNTIVIVTSLMLVIAYLALALFFGATLGFVFVVLVNKLPVRSTYVKATVPSLIIWILPPLLIRPSPASIIGYASASLPALGLFVLDAVIFSYLFDRWKNQTKVGNDI